MATASGGPASSSKAQSSQDKKLTESKEAQLKQYEKLVKDNINSMLENFTEMIKQAKIPDACHTKQSTEGEQCAYEICVRAANVVRAGESLTKLVSDLKQFLILNDFSAIGDCTQGARSRYQSIEEDVDRKLYSLRDQISSDLYQLEDEYFSSAVK